jgi:hypothetical protein
MLRVFGTSFLPLPPKASTLQKECVLLPTLLPMAYMQASLVPDKIKEGTHHAQHKKITNVFKVREIGSSFIMEVKR